MATIDRIDSGYRPWTPSAAGYPSTDVPADDYIGRHRKHGMRGLGLLRMFYSGRHRRAE